MTTSTRFRAAVVALVALIAAIIFTTLTPVSAFAEGPSDGGGSQASDAGGAAPTLMDRTTVYDETGLIDQESLRNSIGNLKDVPEATRIVALISDDLDPDNYDSSVAQHLESLNSDIMNGGKLQVNHVVIVVSPNLRKLGFYVGDAQPHSNAIQENVISAMTPHAQNAAWETSIIAGLNTYFMATSPGGQAVAPSGFGSETERTFFGMSILYWVILGAMVGGLLAIPAIYGFFALLGHLKKRRDMNHLANMTPRGRRLWESKFLPELSGYATKIGGYAYDVDRMKYVPEGERDEMKRELRKHSQHINTLITDAGSMRGNAADAYKEAKALYEQVETKMSRWGREQIREHLGDIRTLAANDSSARSRLNQHQSTSLGDIWIPMFLIHYVATQTPGTTAYESLHAPTSTSDSTSSYSPGSYGGMSGGSASF